MDTQVTLVLTEREAARLLEEIRHRPLRPNDAIDRLARMVVHHIRGQREEARIPARKRHLRNSDGQLLERICALLREAHGSLSGLNLATRLSVTSRLVLKTCRARPDVFAEETNGKHIRFLLREGGPAVHPSGPPPPQVVAKTPPPA